MGEWTHLLKGYGGGQPEKGRECSLEGICYGGALKLLVNFREGLKNEQKWDELSEGSRVAQRYLGYFREWSGQGQRPGPQSTPW